MIIWGKVAQTRIKWAKSPLVPTPKSFNFTKRKTRKPCNTRDRGSLIIMRRMGLEDFTTPKNIGKERVDSINNLQVPA